MHLSGSILAAMTVISYACDTLPPAVEWFLSITLLPVPELQNSTALAKFQSCRADSKAKLTWPSARVRTKHAAGLPATRQAAAQPCSSAYIARQRQQAQHHIGSFHGTYLLQQQVCAL
jgi:hypothetical protein